MKTHIYMYSSGSIGINGYGHGQTQYQLLKLHSDRGSHGTRSCCHWIYRFFVYIVTISILNVLYVSGVMQLHNRQNAVLVADWLSELRIEFCLKVCTIRSIVNLTWDLCGTRTWHSNLEISIYKYYKRPAGLIPNIPLSNKIKIKLSLLSLRPNLVTRHVRYLTNYTLFYVYHSGRHIVGLQH